MFDKKLFLLLSLLLGTILLGFIDVSLMLIAQMIIFPIIYFVFEKRIYIFDGFALYSIYFYLFPLVALVLYFTDFSGNVYYETQVFKMPLDELFNMALFYINLGYVFSYVGYKSVKNKRVNVINLNEWKFDKIVVYIVAATFAALGIINFIYNVFSVAGGDIFYFVATTANRSHDFSTGGTSLYYNFAYMAAYILFHYSLSNDGKGKFFIYLYIIISIFIMFTNGRIISTVTYALSFVAIKYFSAGNKFNNTKYILILTGFLFLAVVLYFARLASSLSMSIETSAIENIIDLIGWDALKYFLVDKGNLPNIVVLMKIIDSWGAQFNFNWGASFFSPFLVPWRNDLPDILLPVSIVVKNNWYSHIEGGNLPPTGIGEMYANFSVLGPIIGMFLFGYLVGLMKKISNKYNNYWVYLFFIKTSLGFVMIYPKGEFDNFSIFNLLYSLIPLLVLTFVSFLCKINKKVEIR